MIGFKQFTRQRIFWKIFLIFGLTNLLVVALGTYLLLYTHQSDNIKKKQEEFIRDIAEVILVRLDRGEKVNQRQFMSSIVAENSRYRRWMERNPISIYNAKTLELVFKSRSFKKQDKNKALTTTTDKGIDKAISNTQSKEFSMVVESPQGNQYIIKTFVNLPKIDVLKSLSRVNKIQFILVLFISAVLSFLLSWSISSPLKKLGAFGRNYKGKSSDQDIDPKLLGRGDEIGDLSRDFKAMRQEIEKTISNQQQLLHDVSHELRAPLARLQTTAGLMEQGFFEENTHLKRIHLECDKINGLIQQILNFSRIEQADVNIQKTDITHTLVSEIEAVTYQHPERDIRRLFDATALYVSIDSDLLAHALANILHNACKHTESSSPIDVSLVEDTTRVTISVRDYGSGVNNAELNTLIKPFYRANNKMHAEGYGLGLSIAKRSMEKNNGDLELANHPEGGLVVSLILYK